MARVLIVDDSTIMRKNLTTIFTQAGHTVVGEAANGIQANLMYRNIKPDLMTLDITMPGMDGIDALKMILKDYPTAKIIMVSALTQRQKVFEALKFGAKHYIIKPITAETVIAVVNKVLGNMEEQDCSTTSTIKNNNGEKAPATQTSETEVKVADDFINSKVPFTIDNTGTMFVIKFGPALSVDTFPAFNMAIQGLLYVKPLNVLINFGHIVSLDDPLLAQMAEIIKDIQNNGTIRVVSQKNEFVQLVKEKELSGFSDIIKRI